MRLRKFKKEAKRNRKKVLITLIVILATLTSILISRTYAFFQKENEVTFINAKIADFKVYLTNVTATSTNNQIDLSYTSSGLNATTTCAFGTTSGTYNLTSTSVNNTKCTKTGLTQNTTYYYKVCSKNNLKQEECKTGSIKTKYNPPTLSTVTATSTTTTIDLSYTESGTVSTRTCKYGATNGSYTTNASSQTSTKCSLTGLNAGTTYYYQVCVSNNGGQNCKTDSIKTKSLADEVEIGDYISLTPTSTSYTISKDLTGYGRDMTINPSELNLWRVIKKNSNGTVEMVSDKVSSTPVYFYGLIGYRNSVTVLTQIAKEYTDEIHVLDARAMGGGNLDLQECQPNNGYCPAVAEDYLIDIKLVSAAYSSEGSCVENCVNNVGYKAETTQKAPYWLGGRSLRSTGSGSSRGSYSGLYFIDATGKTTIADLKYSSAYSDGKEYQKYAMFRPILTLKADTDVASGSGRSSSPYILD